MAANRYNILNQLAQLLVEQNINSPIRVAIDGRTASGKTTFANQVASTIEKLGRPNIRASIDGFHRPKIERYARGGSHLKDTTSTRAIFLPLESCCLPRLDQTRADSIEPLLSTWNVINL
ncbi:hypothetical protein [Pseudovibrio ascidiaceicola]|uniref:hypothetical protein n=1 Tax=Pseudovibrio ascidiaceicola TaxID=285279 RepID=UPI001FCB4CE5|nr:hypothetical protein [Pseudovibrio ascidiaceicola]